VPPDATVVGVPGHVVAYTNRSNETVERLPDPEWERIDGLEQRLAHLEQRLDTTQPTPAAEPAAAPAGSDGAPREPAAGNDAGR